jgi:two-component system sensor histidine kinase DesK
MAVNVTTMSSSWRCRVAQGPLGRFDAAFPGALGVLAWIVPLLLGPLFSLPTGEAGRFGGIALVVVLGTAAVTAVLAGRRRRLIGRVALAALAGGVATAMTLNRGWLPVWALLAICAPAVLRGRWLLGALVLTASGSMLAAWNFGASVATLEAQGFIVSRAGGATTAFLRLVETVDELRRTREKLARVAVAEERERFSRDLHDLLGHTLSVMVVKAQAVRRLATTDPSAAESHAADIEQVGRSALLDVRRAVDAMRALSLSEELAGAERALDAAGIQTSIPRVASVPDAADRTLAWVVREGTTNVLRHSGASRCRIALSNGSDRLSLTMSDDGVGGPTQDSFRDGGLDGLRRRLVAAGGSLEIEPGDHGFRLTATIPVDHS